MVAPLTILGENSALSPLGERVPHDGVFIPRMRDHGAGEGVPTWNGYHIIPGVHTDSSRPNHRITERADALHRHPDRVACFEVDRRLAVIAHTPRRARGKKVAGFPGQ